MRRRKSEDSARRRWETFPMSVSPRPVVLLDSRVHLAAGFVDGDSKVAWVRGAIDSDITMPSGVLERMLQHSRGPKVVTRLRVTGVEPTTAPFLCDRGPRELAAYRVAVTGLKESCVVLDPEVDCWWPTGDEARSLLSREATIESDDRTIHFPAFGGFLTQFHHAVFEEHEAYVVGEAITSERVVPDGTGIPAIGRNRRVIGVLERPLGGRILVNRDDQPLAVTAQSDPA
jgi:hypothetical protein